VCLRVNRPFVRPHPRAPELGRLPAAGGSEGRIYRLDLPGPAELLFIALAIFLVFVPASEIGRVGAEPVQRPRAQLGAPSLGATA
jgi:hypothetical protein